MVAINFILQMERDPERAVRQPETLARHKSTCKRSGTHTWFTIITTVLAGYVSRMFGIRHGRIEQKRA